MDGKKEQEMKPDGASSAESKEGSTSDVDAKPAAAANARFRLVRASSGGIAIPTSGSKTMRIRLMFAG